MADIAIILALVVANALLMQAWRRRRRARALEAAGSGSARAARPITTDPR